LSVPGPMPWRNSNDPNRPGIAGIATSSFWHNSSSLDIIHSSLSLPPEHRLRFQTSDPDIETIVRRIDRHIIDLQPDFQRGEVWSTPKKQRLIDTILRQWHVPPIHLVAKAAGKFDVLDGQQRLTAIRDFVKGSFPVNGHIEPFDESVYSLHGARYGRLPEGVRAQFDAFPIRIFELHDYSAGEPHELFFRLNQPISLTEAEKRNAFIGEPRNQVKKLVDWAESSGMIAERVGFSNARMSYDDLLGRFLLTLEQRTLLEKVTASRITARYRDSSPFPEQVIGLAQASLEFFLNLDLLDAADSRGKPNKATIHTWLCMTAKLIHEGLFTSLGHHLARTISEIEYARFARGHGTDKRLATSLTIFHDRATARVADVASVVLRDLCAWMIFVQASEPSIAGPGPARFLGTARDAWYMVESAESPERDLLTFATSQRWGGKDWL
jgi:hypothetical protein